MIVANDDLRLTLADILEAGGLFHGAQTLRWCAARDAPSLQELQDEIDALRIEVERAYGKIMKAINDVEL